jgi:hypothetical protein
LRRTDLPQSFVGLSSLLLNLQTCSDYLSKKGFGDLAIIPTETGGVVNAVTLLCSRELHFAGTGL